MAANPYAKRTRWRYSSMNRIIALLLVAVLLASCAGSQASVRKCHTGENR